MKNLLILRACLFITNTLPDTNPTILDYAAQFKADDSTKGLGEFIMLAAEQNEILEDLVVMECNDGTKHKSKAVVGIPEPTFRKLYGFVQPSRGTTVPISDNCGMIEDYLEVDVAEADLNGNSARFLASQTRMITEGFNKKIAKSLFYEDEKVTPEGFTGFAPRFNTLDTAAAACAVNVIDAADGAAVAGQLLNQSIWLVNWGDYQVHACFPKGSKAGLQINDKGQVTIQDSAGGRMEAYRTHFRWDIGLAVPDWRHVVRIANIKMSDLTKNAAAGADLLDLLTRALEQIQSTNGKAAIYCSRQIRAFLRRQITSKIASSTLTWDMVAGKRVLAVDGVPVRRVDALATLEDAVV